MHMLFNLSKKREQKQRETLIYWEGLAWVLRTEYTRKYVDTYCIPANDIHLKRMYI